MQKKVLRSQGPVRQARVSASAVSALGLEISSESLSQYAQRAAGLRRRWTRETGGNGDLVDFAIWLLTLKKTVRQSTWRAYRVAVAYWLDGQPDSVVAVAILDDDAAAGERVARAKMPPRTTAAREKCIPANHYEKLTIYLRRFSPSPYAELAANMVEAGILVGFRPDEWRYCMVIGLTFYVKSLKYDRTRGLGPWRTMSVEAMTDRQQDLLLWLADFWGECDGNGGFDLRMRGVARAIKQSCRRIWPGRSGPRYTLYDLRHQFAANAKTSLTGGQVSAVLGHRVTRTASGYASKRRAWAATERPAAPVPPAGVVADLVDNARIWSARSGMVAVSALPSQPCSTFPRPG